MKRGSTLFLKLAVIIIGIPILALCIYLLPQIANVAFEEAANGARLGYMVLGILMLCTFRRYRFIQHCIKRLNF